MKKRKKIVCFLVLVFGTSAGGKISPARLAAGKGFFKDS